MGAMQIPMTKLLRCLKSKKILALLGLAIGTVLIWGSAHLVRMHRDVYNAVLLIENSGGSIDSDYSPFSGPREIFFGRRVPGGLCRECESTSNELIMRISDSTLAFTRLRRLCLIDCKDINSNTIICFMRQHPSLTVLYLEGTSVDDDLLHQINENSDVQELHLSKTIVSAEGVASLSRLNSVKRISLARDQFSPSELLAIHRAFRQGAEIILH